MKRKDDPEVLSSALTADLNKYEDALVSVDETELVEADCCSTQRLFELKQHLKWSIEAGCIANYCQRNSKGNV